MVTTRAVKTMAKRALGWIAAAVGIAAAAPTAASTITYYHNDLAGSPVAATNAAGQVIWRESYRPYGERLTKSASAKSNDVWFTSRREDSSGLVYMGARHYDPVAGRFLSTDPKGFDEGNVQSFNRYAYANDNPLRFSDPNGAQALPLPVSPPPLVRQTDPNPTEAAGAFGNPRPSFSVPGFVSPVLVEIVIFGGAPETVRGLLNIFNDSHDEGDNRGSRRPSADVRQAADDRARDENGNLRCFYCGGIMTPESGNGNSREFDHVKPWSRGGDSSDANIESACRTCNRGKGSKAPQEWIDSQKE